MNVSLTPELERFVQSKVENGRYNSASEVVREALRLLEEHENARVTQLAEFNKELGRRLASLDRGESVDPAATSCSPATEVARPATAVAHEGLCSQP